MSNVLLSGQRVAEANNSSPAGLISTTSSHRSEMDGATVRVRSVTDFGQRDATREPKLKGFVTKRRLKGFVMDNAGETWKVMLVQDGKKYPYRFPSKELRDVGVTEVSQPFEMDEMVSTITGISGKIYRFRPLADVRDATLETLALDSDRQSKRAFILSQLAKLKA